MREQEERKRKGESLPREESSDGGKERERKREQIGIGRAHSKRRWKDGEEEEREQRWVLREEFRWKDRGKEDKKRELERDDEGSQAGKEERCGVEYCSGLEGRRRGWDKYCGGFFQAVLQERS